MKMSMQEFYTMLFNTLDGILTVQYKLCDRINSTRLKNYARNAFSKDVAMNYATIYRTIYNPEHGYANPQEIAQHSIETVQNVLEVN